MNTKTNNTTTNTAPQSKEEWLEVGTQTFDDTVSLGKGLLTFVGLSTQLGVRSANITIDTMNYGLKATLEHAPKNGEEVVDMFSAFMDIAPAKAKPEFVGPTQH